MAKCDVKLPDEFLLKLSKLNDKTDEILPRVLKAGSEVVFNKIKSNLEAVIGTNISIYSKKGSRSTGELVNSLGISPAKQDRDGNWNIKIGFKEPRSDGKSNAKIASVLENGKSNQQARPFVKPAKAQSKQACVDAMKAKFESEVGNI